MYEQSFPFFVFFFQFKWQIVYSFFFSLFEMKRTIHNDQIMCSACIVSNELQINWIKLIRTRGKRRTHFPPLAIIHRKLISVWHRSRYFGIELLLLLLQCVRRRWEIVGKQRKAMMIFLKWCIFINLTASIMHCLSLLLVTMTLWIYNAPCTRSAYSHTF